MGELQIVLSNGLPAPSNPPFFHISAVLTCESINSRIASSLSTRDQLQQGRGSGVGGQSFIFDSEPLGDRADRGEDVCIEADERQLGYGHHDLTYQLGSGRFRAVHCHGR